ncbi:MAG TPA: hypothetical protein VMF13_15055 [Luteitalea sp.]|nr:hypothetical protein [Luteitalea sp.]
MTALFLLWFGLSVGIQAGSPLSLDVRVFRGATEVTGDTTVTVFPAGSRTNGRPAALASGERKLTLPAGQYDIQLLQQADGKVGGIVWTTLRLLADYPGEQQRHLEVLNFEKGWGALQIRQQGAREAGPVRWTARLVRKGGGEVAKGTAGDGYQLLVAPAGTYDVEVTRADGTTSTLPGLEVRENLTYVRTFPTR